MHVQSPRVLITDLDNTLYDWVTFFAKSFYAMVNDATSRFAIEEAVLLDDLRDVHRDHHNSEQPFALLETKSIRTLFPGKSREELERICAPSFDRFNEVRDRTLKLYDGVAATLHGLKKNGTLIVGHTEASTTNALSRLNMLGIGDYFSAIYAIEDTGLGHPSRPKADLEQLKRKVRILRHDERKPDVRVLRDICSAYKVAPNEAAYVGDSLSRDVGMAAEAGLLAIWAKFGTEYDPRLWKQLVRVTHWTQEDVERAERAQKLYAHVRPNIVLDRSYDQMLEHVTFAPY